MLKKLKKKGFTLIELMIVVAIIGILAALAIPNFIRFQARSKQSEVKANLKAAFTAQRSYFQEHDSYSSCIKKIGFAPERGNRYRYTLNTTARTDEDCSTTELRDTDTGTVDLTGRDGDILADEFKYGTGVGIKAADAAKPIVAYTPAVPAGTNIQVTPNLVGVFAAPNVADPSASFGVGAHGDIDSDTNLDLWYVSSVSSVTTGICPLLKGIDQQSPGGEPKNTYNDVNCP